MRTVDGPYQGVLALPQPCADNSSGSAWAPSVRTSNMVDTQAVEEAFAGAMVAPAYFDKDSVVGDVISGPITAVTIRPKREKGKLVLWEDGSPQENLIVTIQTDLIQDEKDDGLRSIYIKWWGAQRKSIAKAVSAAKRAAPQVGDTLSVTYVGEGPQPADKKESPEKLWEYEYTASA